MSQLNLKVLESAVFPLSNSGGTPEETAWGNTFSPFQASQLKESAHDPVRTTLYETIAFHKKRALAEGIDTPKGGYHTQRMYAAKGELQRYLQEKKAKERAVTERLKPAREVISDANDQSTMYDPFDKAQQVSIGLAAKAVNESKGAEALHGHELHQGMMKVAQRHEDEGRPEVADTIRDKAEKFRGDQTLYGRGKEAKQSVREAKNSIREAMGKSMKERLGNDRLE